MKDLFADRRGGYHVVCAAQAGTEAQERKMNSLLAEFRNLFPELLRIVQESQKFRRQVPHKADLFTTGSMGVEIWNYTNTFYTKFQPGEGAARVFVGGQKCESGTSKEIKFEVVK